MISMTSIVLFLASATLVVHGSCVDSTTLEDFPVLAGATWEFTDNWDCGGHDIKYIGKGYLEGRVECAESCLTYSNCVAFNYHQNFNGCFLKWGYQKSTVLGVNCGGSSGSWTYYTLIDDMCDTPSPTLIPTVLPSNSPTGFPTELPTLPPSPSPTRNPTPAPSNSPTPQPTSAPTTTPTEPPTEAPSLSPSNLPTRYPTRSPTTSPTTVPTISPTDVPTRSPTSYPTSAAVANILGVSIFPRTLINAALFVLSFVSLTIAVCACCKLKKLSKLQKARNLNFYRCQEDRSYLPTDTHTRVSTLQLSEISVGKHLEGSHQVKISLGNPDEWTRPQGNTALALYSQGETPQGD